MWNDVWKWIAFTIVILASLWFVSDKLKENGKLIERQITISERANAINQELIKAQTRSAIANEQLIVLQQNTNRNIDTLRTLRVEVKQLESTVTPDIDPSLYENGLNELIQRKYDCLRRVSKGETNAECN